MPPFLPPPSPSSSLLLSFSPQQNLLAPSTERACILFILWEVERASERASARSVHRIAHAYAHTPGQYRTLHRARHRAASSYCSPLIAASKSCNNASGQPQTRRVWPSTSWRCRSVLEQRRERSSQGFRERRDARPGGGDR
eukprot:2667291-Rhodomonas_salina.1